MIFGVLQILLISLDFRPNQVLTFGHVDEKPVIGTIHGSYDARTGSGTP